ncbi:transcriptional regulator [Paracoccus tegillarcae]|uniref:Transcriptional regulator n=2 Tax=Paracoccus tegillarcae TaxID=1529068 RepID=A0A2K9F4E8_9RHOB|nr:H-NS histone family protein [Paracoccus tegillarcae]AUH35272.1 transcriptional regulator [Paracoccus tegillarcae]
MTINFDKMSLKEMKELQGKLERAINSFEDRKRREAMSAVETVAREHGFSLNDLTGGKTRRTGVVPPKYSNPDDPTMTWTGRGRKPRWVQENLEQGKTLDDLTI